MAKAADIGSKRLISIAPDAWIKWVTDRPDVTAGDILSSEFQWLSREGDVLVKASSPQQGEFLVLNELQFRYDSRMPKRMRAYAALAEEKYDLPVYPVVVNILPPEPAVTIPTRYEFNLLGIQARQDYRVINLWEVDVDFAFQPALKTLLPFAPLLRGGGNETVLRRAAQLVQADEQLRDFENLLGFFATYVLELSVIEKIVRFDMTVLRQSPLYEQIIQEGQQQGSLRQLLRQLRRRFGEVPAEVQSTLAGLSVAQLEELGEVFVEVNSLDEFIAAIPAETGNESELK